MPRKKKLPQSTSTKSEQLRLRVFAGPNGSGKSIVIGSVRKIKVNGIPIDFGYYINADDIAQQLRDGDFSFNSFRITVPNKEFKSIAKTSGLINPEFTDAQFIESYTLRKNKIALRIHESVERLAQIIADYLRKKLLNEKRKFSFETVFSHVSKLEIMKEALQKGYKVYLYYVSTESPEINKFRIEARVKQGGHGVPVNKIESRYYRSLEFLYEACQLAYQAFFFDNSVDGQDSVLFAHFKLIKGRKKWDPIDERTVPYWFRKYYSDKVKARSH